MFNVQCSIFPSFHHSQISFMWDPAPTFGRERDGGVDGERLAWGSSSQSRPVNVDILAPRVPRKPPSRSRLHTSPSVNLPLASAVDGPVHGSADDESDIDGHWMSAIHLTRC